MRFTDRWIFVIPFLLGSLGLLWALTADAKTCYSQNFASTATVTLADSQTYWFGVNDAGNANPKSGSSQTYYFIKPPFPGYVTGLSVQSLVATATKGSNEPSTVDLILNSDAIFCDNTLSYEATTDSVNCTLAQAVATTDTIQVRISSPVLVTNPAQTSWTGTLLFCDATSDPATVPGESQIDMFWSDHADIILFLGAFAVFLLMMFWDRKK